MQRSQVAEKEIGVVLLHVVGMLLLFAPIARAANGKAEVAGVVRDAQGIAQMGALVQVFSSDSFSAGAAVTDLHGHYVIPNLRAGRYLVRASATLFVPTTRPNLQLRTGATAVVNLTLAALFDTASWLPAERRRLDETDEDWKWTLRSAANRPMLRLADETEEAPSLDQTTPARTRVKAFVGDGTGKYGASGVNSGVALQRSLGRDRSLNLRAELGDANRLAYGPDEEIEVGYGRRERSGSPHESRTIVSYKSHAEIAQTGAEGLEVLALTSGERMSFGDQVDVDVGGRIVGVHASQFGIMTYPFLHVTGRPNGRWTLQYSMASSPELQQFEDVTTGDSEMPVALVKEGKLTFESGQHHELSASTRLGGATVRVAYYHDASKQTSVAGVGAVASSALKSGEIPRGMTVDRASGSFRTLGPGYVTNGARITISSPESKNVSVMTELSEGDALAAVAGERTSGPETLGSLKIQRSAAATFSMRGRLPKSGTRVRASYRWQPSEMVTAVDPFADANDQAFVSLMLRQPIRWGNRLPTGLDAMIDVTNLLAEGYRPFVSADGQTLYFAQAPRTIQAGLSFSF